MDAATQHKFFAECENSVTIIVVLCCGVSQSVKHNLLAAFRHLLRPLVRIAIQNGVAFPQFAGALRDAYVNVASSNLKVSGGNVSADSIALMTEIDSADVREILQSPDVVELHRSDRRMNSVARVLMGWHTDREYIGPYGLVRDLPFVPTDSQATKDVSGFVDLAKQYCPSIPPKVVLDELIRTGCVKDLGNGFYRALTRLYVPQQLSPESIRHLAQVVHNITETLEVNLRRSVRGTGRIQRTVYADYGLRREDLEAFDKYVRDRGQLFADDIDKWLSDRSSEAQLDAVQTGIGYYHYVVNNDDEKDFERTLKMEGDEG